MIRHIVLARFRADVPQPERDAIFAAIDAVRDAVPGMLAARYGANVSPEGLDRGFDAGFTIDFADEAARDAYLVDPAHQAAGARLVTALDGGLAGLVVVDLEV